MTRPTDREVNTAVYLLRSVQLGLTLSDLESIDEGLVIDMMIEAGNDTAEYNVVATQADMDRF